MELNKLDLNKLNTFVAVVERGGITPAASALFLTRSAVSQSISSLERALGVPLFNRVGKRLIPTTSGEHLFRSVQTYQLGLRRTVDEILSRQDTVRGTVRLGLFVGFSKRRIAGILQGYLARYPEAGVKLAFRSRSELVSQLVSGKLDLALSLDPLSRENRALRSHKLCEEELILVGAPLMLDARSKSAPALTANEAFALPAIDYYQSGSLMTAWFAHHFGRALKHANTRAFAGTAELVLELILAGSGVGVVARALAEPYLDSGELVHLRAQGSKKELTGALWLNELNGTSLEQAPLAFRGELERAVT